MEHVKHPLSLSTYILLVVALLVANYFVGALAEARTEGSSTVHRRQRIGIKVK